MKYMNGIKVKEGDVVLFHRAGFKASGTVLKVIKPGTEDAVIWSVPNGGVLIEGGGLGLSVSSSLEDDEDIEFIRRANDLEK